eukprot:gene517-550_t
MPIVQYAALCERPFAVTMTGVNGRSTWLEWTLTGSLYFPRNACYALGRIAQLWGRPLQFFSEAYHQFAGHDSHSSGTSMYPPPPDQIPQAPHLQHQQLTALNLLIKQLHMGNEGPPGMEGNNMGGHMTSGLQNPNQIQQQPLAANAPPPGQGSVQFGGTRPVQSKPWHGLRYSAERDLMINKIVNLLQQRRPNAPDEWHQKLPQMAKRLEEALYNNAKS